MFEAECRVTCKRTLCIKIEHVSGLIISTPECFMIPEVKRTENWIFIKPQLDSADSPPRLASPVISLALLHPTLRRRAFKEDLNHPRAIFVVTRCTRSVPRCNNNLERIIFFFHRRFDREHFQYFLPHMYEHTIRNCPFRFYLQLLRFKMKEIFVTFELYFTEIIADRTWLV